MADNVPPQSGEFCWNELMTPDTKKAQAFYTHLLGWTTEEHDMDDKTYTLFMSGEKHIGGMMETPKDKLGQVPPHWTSYICVEDLEKTLNKAESLGATVKVSVQTVPDRGRFAVIQDPTGAHIAFWESFK